MKAAALAVQVLVEHHHLIISMKGSEIQRVADGGDRCCLCGGGSVSWAPYIVLRRTDETLDCR